MSYDEIDLTEFQKNAVKRITDLAESRKMPVIFSVEGKSEPYVLGEIKSAAIKLWIYEDEIEMKGNDIYRLLERPDFEKPEYMLDYLLNDLEAALSNCDQQ